MSFGASLIPWVKRSPTLQRLITPIAKWYVGTSGYQKQGLLYDDLIQEESPVVQRAISRLTPREQFDRAFRLKRASHCSVLHRPLPKEQWTTPEQDIRYLTPHIVSVLEEEKERKLWDSLSVKPNKH
ncbi:cytochrome b-c1 complex subunit 7 [Flagelloscypha sp. PMI_526]|nr:cytochrome b-c1 complex subunit 7 [Flagelloscypha sp. PMI_526]